MNNRNMLVVVSGYSGDKHQVETNLPVYLHHGCTVLVLSPSDAPITSVSNSSVHCQWMGQRGYTGLHTLERQRLYLQQLLTFPQDWFLFNDSDSFCLSPQLPEYLFNSETMFHANIVTDTNPGPSLLPKVALQPPYFFHRHTIARLLEGAADPAPSYHDANNVPALTKCIDHWMLQIAHSGGVCYRSFLNGASFETSSDEGAKEMENLVRVHGHVFIHSVKTKRVLDLLINAHAARPA